MSTAFENIKKELDDMYFEENLSDKELSLMAKDLIELYKIHFNHIRKENKAMCAIDYLMAA